MKEKEIEGSLASGGGGGGGGVTRRIRRPEQLSKNKEHDSGKKFKCQFIFICRRSGKKTTGFSKHFTRKLFHRLPYLLVYVLMYDRYIK